MTTSTPMFSALVPAGVSSLRPWVLAGVFGSAEVHGADVLTRVAPTSFDSDSGGDELVQLAAACALWAPLHGHACVDLTGIAALVDTEVKAQIDDRRLDESVHVALPWPPLEMWLDALRRSPACRLIEPSAGADPIAIVPLDDRPLVLHGTLLYTQRQWADERSVTAQLLARVGPHPSPTRIQPATLDVLERLLPPTEDGVVNQQHRAVLAALHARLTVVVGGPGTGKTHTIARLLATLIQQADGRDASLRIGLAAPTGKAATRMRDALTAAIATMVNVVPDSAIRQLTDLQPSTIHRLLGVRGQRTRFAHDADRPLDHDIVVIDEASMVALPMMARLVEALRPDAQLVLVGDPDQLESIEVGAVLADIVTASRSASSPLAGSVIRLDRPRRHAADSPIGPLADAIRLADADQVLALLRHGARHAGSELITFLDTDALDHPTVEAAVREIVIPPLQAAASAAAAGRANDALDQFADVRVLCAHRSGAHGAEHWNRLVESWLFADNASARPPRYYPGRALLVTRNDLRQRIANGDTGVIVAHRSAEGATSLRAALATAEGVRLLAPAQLDSLETAFAMTIHKSQGSEYATVVVVLPPATSPLIGRELLYTAITRATRRVVVVGSSAAVIAAVQTPARRVTGLANALR